MSCFLLFTGKLLEQAKENVKAQGYNFVKGHSRGNTGESSGEQGKKRKKVAKDERQREIQSIKEVIDNISEQMKFKQLRLEKHNSLKEYGKCDTIGEEICNLMREKKIQEKQLTLLEKKSQNQSGTTKKEGSNEDDSENHGNWHERKKSFGVMEKQFQYWFQHK